MTEHHDDPLADVDATARRAAGGLRDHVRARLEGDPLSLAPEQRQPSGRNRFLAVAAAVVLVTASVAVLGGGGDDGSRSRLDLDELPEPGPEAGQLRPLGPRDGLESIQLPLSVEPNAGLEDGDVVAVSGSGFVPGEQVGIVQCAKEAGGDSPEVRGGVDGCNIGSVVYVDADEEGTISGRFEVRRVLTTPLTGTVDCATESERCIVAAGALSDYDRSGGHGVTFADSDAPVDIPSVTVTPSDGLADGDVVHVAGTGFTPDSVVNVTICSSDPAACWQSGEAIAVDEDGSPSSARPDEARGGMRVGLVVDADGNVDGDVPVWRFLPGMEPGTYADCAVSRCSLRLTGETAPPTVPLGFEPGGEAPAGPVVSVDPTTGLEVGDRVLVRGAGFVPGAQVYVSLCGAPPSLPDIRYSCGSTGAPYRRVADDGTFTVELEIPDLGEVEAFPTTTSCAPGTCGGDLGDPTRVDVTCDGVTTTCAIVVETYPGDVTVGPPVWAPSPVPVTFG